MKPLLTTLVSTGKGWFIRQAMKWAVTAGATVSGAIVTHASTVYVDPAQAAELAAKADQFIGGGIGLLVSIALAILEGWLSKKAAPIAAK